MRKVIICFCLLLASLSMQAQSLQGIRIESEGQPVVVYINDQPVNTPTASCFVTNLSSGHYRVEVYSGRLPERPSMIDKRKHLIYSESVNYRGRGIHEIFIENESNKGKGPQHGSKGPHGKPQQEKVMSPAAFETFLKQLKAKPFADQRLSLIEGTLPTTLYSSEQGIQIMTAYVHDHEKMQVMKAIYPNIADKQNFFMVVEKLSFQSNKNEVNEFIRKFHEDNK